MPMGETTMAAHHPSYAIRPPLEKLVFREPPTYQQSLVPTRRIGRAFDLFVALASRPATTLW